MADHPYGCLCADCRAEKSRQRMSLFDLSIDEVSFVGHPGGEFPGGDNPGAHILMHKHAPGDDAEEERIIKQAIAEVQAEAESEREAVMTQTLAKKSDVVAEVERRATELRKQDEKLTPARARVEVWMENEDLARRYRELDVDTEAARSEVAAARAEAMPTDKGAETVQKGGDTLGKVDAHAADLRRRDPSLTMAKARIQVWDTHPELADEYRAALDR